MLFSISSFRAFALASVTSFALTACSTSQVAKLPALTQENISQFKLQLAVGTATIAHLDATQPPYVGVNVVSTFRKPNGLSATLDNTPTLTGPPGFKTMRGLSPSELLAADSYYLSNPATVSTAPGSPYAAVLDSTAFNTVIGVYGYGFAPLNLTPNAQNADIYGTAQIPTLQKNCIDFGLAQGIWDAVRYMSLYLPALRCNDPVTSDAGRNFFNFYGGPPAWPSPQSAGMPAAFIGFPAGFMDVYAQPLPGTYALDVAIPASSDLSSYQHFTATAQLPPSQTAAPLPVFTKPVITPKSDGSATIAINVPSGVTEAIVFIQHFRCDLLDLQQGLPHAQYSVLTRQAGAQTLTIPGNLGPPSPGSTQPTHTFCLPGDAGYFANRGYTAVAVGFDYPAFEASYPQNMSSAPAITNGDGHAGTADLTSSSVVQGADYSGGP